MLKFLIFLENTVFFGLGLEDQAFINIMFPEWIGVEANHF